MCREQLLDLLAVFIVTVMIGCQSPITQSAGGALEHPTQDPDHRYDNGRARECAKNFTAAVSKIARAKVYSKEEDEAARDLEGMSLCVNPNDIDDATMTKIIDVLDRRSISVRLFVVDTIGNLGPRAHAALPKLYRCLEQEEAKGCFVSTETPPALYIRRAIPKVGGQWIPAEICSGGKPFRMSGGHGLTVPR
jgi:hypothetical protein